MNISETERKIFAVMGVPPEGVEYLAANYEEYERGYKQFMESMYAGLEAMAQAINEFTAAVTAAWEAARSLVSAVDFEELAALAVEAEKIKPVERVRPRPARNTINRQYKQPVKAVHRTARSRLK